MEETAQLVPPRNPGEATLPSPPQPPLSLVAPSGLRACASAHVFRLIADRQHGFDFKDGLGEKLC
ncbi:MAG: hypothetical protein HYW48_07925 [Deltaproteobacteria bacterium]|nr:hypothetical protein [Deltaproteobacteria bacterium]